MCKPSRSVFLLAFLIACRPTRREATPETDASREAGELDAGAKCAEGEIAHTDSFGVLECKPVICTPQEQHCANVNDAGWSREVIECNAYGTEELVIGCYPGTRCYEGLGCRTIACTSNDNKCIDDFTWHVCAKDESRIDTVPCAENELCSWPAGCGATASVGSVGINDCSVEFVDSARYVHWHITKARTLRGVAMELITGGVTVSLNWRVFKKQGDRFTLVASAVTPAFSGAGGGSYVEVRDFEVPLAVGDEIAVGFEPTGTVGTQGPRKFVMSFADLLGGTFDSPGGYRFECAAGQNLIVAR